MDRPCPNPPSSALTMTNFPVQIAILAVIRPSHNSAAVFRGNLVHGLRLCPSQSPTCPIQPQVRAPVILTDRSYTIYTVIASVNVLRPGSTRSRGTGDSTSYFGVGEHALAPKAENHREGYLLPYVGTYPVIGTPSARNTMLQVSQAPRSNVFAPPSRLNS